MIDIVENMVAQRKDFVDYCSTILSEESMLWVKRFFSEINKVVLIQRDDDFTVKVWPLYKNVKRFMEDFIHEPTPSAILMSLYICGMELGILSPGDSVESLVDFRSDIPVINWDDIQYSDMLQLDFYSENVLVRRAFYQDDSDDVYVGGLRVLSLLDYLEVS